MPRLWRVSGLSLSLESHSSHSGLQDWGLIRAGMGAVQMTGPGPGRGWDAFTSALETGVLGGGRIVGAATQRLQSSSRRAVRHPQEPH